MTYTDSSADSNAFSGKTKSVGGGLMLQRCLTLVPTSI